MLQRCWRVLRFTRHVAGFASEVTDWLHEHFELNGSVRSAKDLQQERDSKVGWYEEKEGRRGQLLTGLLHCRELAEVAMTGMKVVMKGGADEGDKVSRNKKKSTTTVWCCVCVDENF